MSLRTGSLLACTAPVVAALVATMPVAVAQPGSAALGPAALSAIPRVLEEGDALPCDGLPLTVHRGAQLRYSKPPRVHRDFAPRLALFEALVIEVARRHYGRAPRRIVHLGTYNCRRMRTYPNWVSEHALGNAIDVAGFDFGPLPRAADSPSSVALPKRLRRAFSVRVERHFRGPSRARGAASELAARHAAFLHDLTRALIARPDIFSVVLGPGWPGHHNHLHLDAAPYRVVEVDLPDA